MITRPVKPIILKGNEYGVLLLHGFTGTPQCLESFAEAFHKAKYTVSAPMIEGHATHHTHLEKTKWEDWYGSAELALQELCEQCEKVFVLGLSMGGLLTLHLASLYPQAVSAIALLATPAYLDGFLIRQLFPVIWKTPLRFIYRYQTKYRAAINDPQMKRKYQTYDKIPVRSVAELLEFQSIVRQELRHIRQPTFIAHALADTTVPYGNLDYLRATLGSRDIQTMTLKASNHIITMDYERDKLFKTVKKFFDAQKKRKFY